MHISGKTLPEQSTALDSEKPNKITSLNALNDILTSNQTAFVNSGTLSRHLVLTGFFCIQQYSVFY